MVKQNGLALAFSDQQSFARVLNIEIYLNPRYYWFAVLCRHFKLPGIHCLLGKSIDFRAHFAYDFHAAGASIHANDCLYEHCSLNTASS